MPPVLSRHRDTTTTKEQDNFLRIHILLFDIGTKCVRKVFDREFHPSQLATVLNPNRFKLQKIVNPCQMKLLYPPRGAPPVKSVMFDMTLMMCLLKHLAGQSIDDKCPFEANHSIEADLSRLKYYRNLFCHLPTIRINDQTFEKWSQDILQVIERLGGNDWIEECEQIRVCCLDTRLNDVKFLLLQLFIILHTKGYDMSSRVSESFWSFSPIHQLRFILSLLEFHFWIFPPIYIIWNEFQDSYHRDSDIKFFERTECKSDTKGADCFPRPSSATGTMYIGGCHTIEIECKNCSSYIKKEDKMRKLPKKNRKIKMICSCKKGLVAAEICFMALFTQLNPIYKYNDNTGSPTNSDDSDCYTYLKIEDCVDDEKRNVVQSKQNMWSTGKTISSYVMTQLRLEMNDKMHTKVPGLSRNDSSKCMFSNSSALKSSGNGSYIGICSKKKLLN